MSGSRSSLPLSDEKEIDLRQKHREKRKVFDLRNRSKLGVVFLPTPWLLPACVIGKTVNTFVVSVCWKAEEGKLSRGAFCAVSQDTEEADSAGK